MYVDDATSQLMQLHFCEAESTFECFEATRGYIEWFGKPVAFYSDKASVSGPPGQGAQAAGNLEHRCSQLFRARVRSFAADFNARFAKKPRNDFDAHRSLLADENLDDIFCWQELRKVSKSLTINYQRRLFLLEDTNETRALAGKHVTVFELRDGTVQVRAGTRSFAVTEFGKDEARISQGAVVSNKLLAGALQHIKQRQKKKDVEKLRQLRTKRDKELLRKRAQAAV